MRLSEIEQALAMLREQFGDVEVYEATPEYGTKPTTKESFESFVKFETTIYKDGRPDKLELVMGHH